MTPFMMTLIPITCHKIILIQRKNSNKPIKIPLIAIRTMPPTRSILPFPHFSQHLLDASNIGGYWVPLLDTVCHKKSTNDTYWPVEVHGRKLVCMLLCGGKEYPDAGSHEPVHASSM